MRLCCAAYLSEDVAGQGLVQPGLFVYELKQIQALPVLLHHQLEVAAVLKHLQHLQREHTRVTQVTDGA